MSLFSVPTYPGAVGYTVQYSDPDPANPNLPSSLGTWTTLLTGTPNSSNIYDAAGDDRLRLYRVSPIILNPNDNVTPITLRPYAAFSVEEASPGVYSQVLFDAQITSLLPQYREFIGDYGDTNVTSTDINRDSGASVGLLTPDGTTKSFGLSDVDTASLRVLEYSVQVDKNGIRLLLDTDYSVDWQRGRIMFKIAPAVDDAIDIVYTQVKYTNAMLNMSLQAAIASLASFGINGYGLAFDRNVITLQGVIGSTLRPIVFTLGQKIINRAMIRKISEEARSYKTADFSIDTAPGRLIDGISTQSSTDFDELRTMANQYIKSATLPMVRDAYMSFFDFSGIIPIVTPFLGSFYMAGYSYYM